MFASCFGQLDVNVDRTRIKKASLIRSLSESEESTSKSEDIHRPGYRGSYDASGKPTVLLRFSPANSEASRKHPSAFVKKDSSRSFEDERSFRRVKSDVSTPRKDESGFLDRAFASAANIGDEFSDSGETHDREC
jgi:hypothetical protein